MTIDFYMAEDGEVLSNKEYPVRSRMLLLPELGRARPQYCEAVSTAEVAQRRIKYRLYRAVAMRCADGLFEVKDGIMGPAHP